MAREVLREAFFNGSDDHYEYVEMDVATRLSGGMLFMVALLAAVAPPADGTGLAALCGLLAVTVPLAFAQVRRSTPSRPGTLRRCPRCCS